MQRYNILWADDEIELLKPHILFLEGKGAKITPVNNGVEAVEYCSDNNYDVVFLDENMPGLSGLDALTKIKALKPNLPVIMITKNEEEQIMEEAIGAKITDYLIKPINPSQILLSVKKVLENKRLVSEKTNLGFQQEFRELSMEVNSDLTYDEWTEVYKRLVFWELEIDNTEDKSMSEVLDSQKSEANKNFSTFIMRNYEKWLNDPESERPLLSHQLMKKKVFPKISENSPLFFLVIDNLRFDQWKVIEPLVLEYFNIEEEETYYSILPTTTAYSRNAIFSGMLPDEMAEKCSDIWVGDDNDEGKNNNEKEFLSLQLQRNGLSALKTSYQKIKNIGESKVMIDSINNLMGNNLNVIVYNFVDMLSHARTDMAMIRELAPDESAYRSITRSWFEHSPLHEAIKRIARKKGKLIITTDHGTIRVQRPFKIIGDRNTNTNLRYKQGRNLKYKSGRLLEALNPEKVHLPKTNLSSTYVFALEDQFFAYPNNYNYYVNYFKDTFQHGGVSLEEMVIPVVSLTPK